MTPERRILIIGAGASGLTAVKSCKEESLDVTCYEKSKHFGGWWRYRENSAHKEASVMKSTVCISSKEMGAFSDFPPPSNFPNYLHHAKMLAYLTQYAQKFDLIRHIKYQMEVIKIIPSPNYNSNGKWLVTSTNHYNKSEIKEEFDGIMVCTGHLSEPSVPSFPNQEVFAGKAMHSQVLKSSLAFQDLKVLIVGSGNSAVDAAVEISTVAEQVYLSSKNGFWLFPKLGPNGLPFDMHILRRDIHFLKTFCSEIANRFVERYLETKINHEACQIKPSYRALDKHPTVNDDLPDKILTGRVIIKSQISTFEKTGVIFEHENDVTELDCVVFATGYKTILPFLNHEINITKDDMTNLYKYVFPVDLKHSTLAFIGFVESNGPHIPISESQARWTSRIFAKKLSLPKNEAMKSYTASTYSRIKNSSAELMVDYMKYMDELAEEYGVKPNISSLLFKDSSLFWACFTGPFLPYQYRLVGPHTLENARDLILNYRERVKEPLNSKKLCRLESKGKYEKHTCNV